MEPKKFRVFPATACQPQIVRVHGVFSFLAPLPSAGFCKEGFLLVSPA